MREGAGVFIGHRRGHGVYNKVSCSPSWTLDATAAALWCASARVCGGAGTANIELGRAEVVGMWG
jgi:hypothetical protein